MVVLSNICVVCISQSLRQLIFSRCQPVCCRDGYVPTVSLQNSLSRIELKSRGQRIIVWSDRVALRMAYHPKVVGGPRSLKFNSVEFYHVVDGFRVRASSRKPLVTDTKRHREKSGNFWLEWSPCIR